MSDATRIRLANIRRPVGFAWSNVRQGDQAHVACRAMLISDDTMFYKVMDSVTDLLFNPAHLVADSVHQFLGLFHADDSADLFVNDCPMKVQITPKRNLERGQLVSLSDIADIQRLEFDGIEIKETDAIICCIKVGWKFGLLFDFSAVYPDGGKLDIDALPFALGDLYRYLRFEHVYKTLEANDQFELMKGDGWFPFIEIHGAEFKELTRIYGSQIDIEAQSAKLVDKFDVSRIAAITCKWWTKPQFAEKQTILQAGIKAYLQNDQAGFILCCKTLLSEIEGLIRSTYFDDKAVDTRRYRNLTRYLGLKGETKTVSKTSLFLPRHFVDYLDTVIFRDFDLASGDVVLSRNTVSHGIANAGQYTKMRALQAILVLDQLYFYL